MKEERKTMGETRRKGIVERERKEGDKGWRKERRREKGEIER